MSKYVFDESIKLAENAMLKARPELFEEWDFEKNDELGLDIYQVTKGSNKKANWICKDCNSHWLAMINDRTNNNGCPYCRGLRVNDTNSLQSLNPKLAKEWHPTKNVELTPNEVTTGSNRKAWWLGKCGHEWNSSIKNRVIGQSCPYCSNKKLLIGFNDMWTTNPQLASQLADPEDGYKYMQSSSKKVDWKCNSCKSKISQKLISTINKQGLSCSKCCDGKSLPEKVMFNLLKYLDIYFIPEKIFYWSDKKRYDFYLPKYDIIIEMHGAQHYKKQGYKNSSLDKIQKNDKLKEDMAKLNNIKEFIVIDCSILNFDNIKSNIMDSKLTDLFNLEKINWKNIEYKANESLVSEVCNFYEKDTKRKIKDIAYHFKLSISTTRKYLNIGARIGICSYNGKRELQLNGHKNSQKKMKKIVQMDKSMYFIKKWDNIQEITNNFNINKSCIYAVCNGNRKTSLGFKWMYEDDYYKLLNKGNDDMIKVTVKKSFIFNFHNFNKGDKLIFSGLDLDKTGLVGILRRKSGELLFHVTKEFFDEFLEY
mgnify:CR=1 FL=1